MERRSRTLSSPRAAIGNQRSIRRVSGIAMINLWGYYQAKMLSSSVLKGPDLR